MAGDVVRVIDILEKFNGKTFDTSNDARVTQLTRAFILKMLGRAIFANMRVQYIFCIRLYPPPFFAAK